MLTVGALLLTGTALLWGFDYESFSDVVLQYVGKSDWKGYFQQQVFTAARFALARWLALATLPIYIGFLWFFVQRWRGWAAQLSSDASSFGHLIRHKIKDYRRTAPLWEKCSAALILLLLIGRTLYTVYDVAIQYDEAWTYNHFVSKGFLACLLSPNNNHILYTLFACITDWLPLPHHFALRLPAMLAGWATCVLFYLWLRTWAGNRAAIISFAFISFSSAIYFYTLYARAYSLTYLFVVLQLWALWSIAFAGGGGRRHWWCWGGASIAGLYSSPVYLYPLFGLNIALLFMQGFSWRWTRYSVYILLISLLLYAPFFITNGFSVLTQAATAGDELQMPSSAAFRDYIGSTMDIWFTGQRWDLWWCFWAAIASVTVFTLVYLRQPQCRLAGILLLLHALMPLYTYAVTQTQTPLRVWLFVLLFWALWLAVLVRQFLDNQKPLLIALLATAVGTGNWLWSSQQHFTDWSYHLDKSVRQYADFLLRQQPAVTECFSFARYDKPMLEYYFLTHHRHIKVYLPYAQSKDYRAFGARTYQIVLWDKDIHPSPAAPAQLSPYHTIYEDYRLRLLQAK